MEKTLKMFHDGGSLMVRVDGDSKDGLGLPLDKVTPMVGTYQGCLTRLSFDAKGRKR